MKVHKLVGTIEYKGSSPLLVFDLENYDDCEALKNKGTRVKVYPTIVNPFDAFFTNWGCPICKTTLWGIKLPKGFPSDLHSGTEVLCDITVPYRPNLI